MSPIALCGLVGCIADKSEELSVPLKSVRVAVAVHGFVARVTATLSYNNTHSDPLQVLFRCPVDESSALYHVEVKLQDRTIIGKCLEKKKAEKVYEDALAAGQTALLVKEESQTADLITLALGNLPPESTAEVSLSFVCELRVATDGGVQFTLPTVVNPRYAPAGAPGLDPWNHTQQDGHLSVVSHPYAIDIEGVISGGQAITRVVSHTDTINVVIDDDNTKAKITQESGGFRSDHDWSFVVYYNNPYTPHVLVEGGDVTATGLLKDQVVMVNLFPQLPESSYSHYNEVIFIVDRSGSMQGENIQSARAVLLLFLKSLPPGCLFNVISFGSSHSMLFPEGSREYSEATLAEAQKLHDEIEADMGGTEILQPLKTVYSKPAHSEYSRQILLLTDGEVYNVDEVMSLASRNATNTRVFTVGIGEGASTALVRGLAREGGGRAEMVTQRDRVQTKVMGLVASMLQSSVRGVTVSAEFDSPTRFRLVPAEPPVIFAGQHFTAYARMPPNTVLKQLTVSGRVDGVPWTTSVSNAHAVHDTQLCLHRLAARAAIRAAALHDNDDARDEVVELSVVSGVLSRYTALVAVDQDGKTLPKPKPRVERVEPQMEYMSGAPGALFGMRCMKAKRSAPSACFAMSACAAPAPPPPPYGGMAFGALVQQSDCAAPPPPPPCGGMTFGAQQSLFGSSSSPKARSAKTKLISYRSQPVNDSVDSMDCRSGDVADSHANQEEESKPDIKATKDDVFLQLVGCQKFDGSWTVEAVEETLGISLHNLQQQGFKDISAAAFATGLAIALLQDCFSDRALEWSLLVIKAKAFFQKQFAALQGAEAGNKAESELQKIKECVNVLRNSHPDLVIFS